MTLDQILARNVKLNLAASPPCKPSGEVSLRAQVLRPDFTVEPSLRAQVLRPDFTVEPSLRAQVLRPDFADDIDRIVNRMVNDGEVVFDKVAGEYRPPNWRRFRWQGA